MENIDYSKMISVCVYCDSTDLYTEEECNRFNLCYLEFPKDIVLAWYAKNEDDFIKEQRDELGADTECSFKTWIENVYTAEDTVDLYWFAIDEYGFTAEKSDWLL